MTAAITTTPTPSRVSTVRDVAVIVNANATRAAAPERLLARVMAQLRAAGARSWGLVTGSERELSRTLREADGTRVALVGGDGSLHAAANLAPARAELALIPTGRANNVARALGIPAELDEAARIAASAPARPLDVLRVESVRGVHRCVEVLSAGFQADARRGYRADNSGDLGAGLRLLAGALRRYRPYQVALHLDGQPAYAGEAAQVFLSNLPFFGFRFRVDPVAHPSDSLLEAIVLRASTRLELARRLISVYRGRHLEGAGSRLRRARSADITSPLPLTCDSTPLGVGQASVMVEPAKLWIASPWNP